MPWTSAGSTARAVDYVVTAANWNDLESNVNYLYGTTGLVEVSSGFQTNSDVVINSTTHSRIWFNLNDAEKMAIVYNTAGGLEFYNTDGVDVLLFTIEKNTGNVVVTGAETVAGSLICSSSASVVGKLTCSTDVTIYGTVNASSLMGVTGTATFSVSPIMILNTTRPETLYQLWNSSGYILVSTGPT